MADPRAPMTPEQARAFVLARIDRDRHVEPFRFRGRLFQARVPSMMQLEVARAGPGATNRTIFLASLAVQCTELDGQRVFAPNDIAQLVQDHPHGFLTAFIEAISPFLEAPVLPAAMVRRG